MTEPVMETVEAAGPLLTLTRTLVYGQALPVPVTLNTTLDALIIQPTLNLSDAAPPANALGQITRTQMIAAINAVKATWLSPTVGLYTNNVVWTDQIALSGLTEAGYGGYAATAITFGAAFDLPDGTLCVTAPSVQFQGTGTGLPVTIQGWFVAGTF